MCLKEEVKNYDGVFLSVNDIRFGVELERMVDQELEQCEKVYYL